MDKAAHTENLDQITELNWRIEELTTERNALQSDNASLVSHSELAEALLELVPVGLVIADEQGRIYKGNRRAEELVRHPIFHSADADSYGDWVAFHEDGRRVESHEYPLAQIIRNEAEFASLDVHYQRGDGSLFWMRIIGRPVRDKNGQRIGAAVVLIDIDNERRLLEQKSVLIGELDHRAKNIFTVVRSIVSQSMRKAGAEDWLRTKIEERIEAYAAAHSRLVTAPWDHSPIHSTVSDITKGLGGSRVFVDGPDLLLPSRQAMALSMAFYELMTNALKYGALSVETGRVDIVWRLDEQVQPPLLSISWTETGGPEPRPPERKGFGSFIIDRTLSAETGGKVSLSYLPTGLSWKVDMPFEPLTSSAEDGVS